MTESNVFTITFEDVVSAETWDFACECVWHRAEAGTAEWAVRGKRPCCGTTKVALWCNLCLVAVVSYRGNVNCAECGEPYPAPASCLTWEPIRKPDTA